MFGLYVGVLVVDVDVVYWFGVWLFCYVIDDVVWCYEVIQEVVEFFQQFDVIELFVWYCDVVCDEWQFVDFVVVLLVELYVVYCYVVGLGVVGVVVV